VGCLLAFKWAWHIAETNLRCVRSLEICKPNLNSLALIVYEISAFIRTDMARSTRLVILFKNIYTLWGRKRFLLPDSDESSVPFYFTSNGYKNTREMSYNGSTFNILSIRFKIMSPNMIQIYNHSNKAVRLVVVYSTQFRSDLPSNLNSHPQ